MSIRCPHCGGDLTDFGLTFRAKVKILRKQRGWTLADVAKRAGVSVVQIHHLETGKKGNPRLSTVEKMAEVFGVSASDLITRSPSSFELRQASNERAAA